MSNDIFAMIFFSFIGFLILSFSYLHLAYRHCKLEIRVKYLESFNTHLVENA